VVGVPTPTTYILFAVYILMKKSSHKNYCTLYIVRHGQTEWNVEKRIQGHTNSKLTTEGIKQARATADKLKPIQFDAVFSSDLLRAHDTAKILLLERKLAIITTKALRERSFGNLEGKLSADVQTELQYIFNQIKAFTTEEQKKISRIKDVETEEQLVSRFITFLREVAVAYPNKTILIVTHGGIMIHFIQHLAFMTNFYVSNASYIKVESDGVDFFIKETEGITKRDQE
jgi:2,3-bisphosphoglycerate-dependent phosphoglycerate mutase